MFKQYDFTKISRDILSYDEDVRIRVVSAYLFDNKSHRQIQREILGLPAPAHGGGFVAMNILHFYGISGQDKGLLVSKSIEEVLFFSNDSLRKILLQLQEYVTYKTEIKSQIAAGDFHFRDKNTEISVMTKIRLNQHVLRDMVLENYDYTCAVCPIHSQDLLICSHIIPWAVDRDNRLNPANAICFCVLHDRLFEKGYFTLDDEFNVLISSKADSHIRFLLKDIEFKAPKRGLPGQPFLFFHKKETFGK